MIKLGIGVIIVNPEKKILIGKRIGSHAPFYSVPGGHLEVGESFETAAIREIKEETNLIIEDPRVIAVTNNLETYTREGYHSVSIILLAEKFSGSAKIMEPHKCESWQWSAPHELPTPHFDASRTGIECYLQRQFYKS